MWNKLKKDYYSMGRGHKLHELPKPMTKIHGFSWPHGLTTRKKKGGTNMAKYNLNSNLGTLAIYSLETNLSISATDLTTLATKHNVPLGLLPNPLTDEGAFQRATTALRSGCSVENPINVKEVLNDGTNIVRVVERRINHDDVDKISHGSMITPQYEHVATISFEKATSTVTYVAMTPIGDELCKEAMARYQHLSGTRYNITQVRAMIQRAFRFYEGVQFRKNGGCTFIPEYNKNAFNEFVAMCDELPKGINLFVIDMKMSPNNRDHVLANLAEQVSIDLEEEIKNLNGTVGNKVLSELVNDFSIALKESKCQKNKLESMAERFAKTKKLVQDYQKLLQCDLSTMSEQLDLASQQLVQLCNKAHEDEETA
jgi:hypothetical protein